MHRMTQHIFIFLLNNEEGEKIEEERILQANAPSFFLDIDQRFTWLLVFDWTKLQHPVH